MVLERLTVNKELITSLKSMAEVIWSPKLTAAMRDHYASIWQDNLCLRIDLRHWHWSQNGPHFISFFFFSFYFLNALMFPLDILAKQIVIHLFAGS